MGNEENVELEEDVPEETVEVKKEKLVKKAVRKRKSKKEKESPISSALRLAVETGKVEFGSKAGLKNAFTGKVKLLVLAANTPAETAVAVVKYSKASEIPLIYFEGSSIELGSICGKPFPIAVLSIHEEGNSDILKLAKK
jgi:large subunit ribosomal protein L30e